MKLLRKCKCGYTISAKCLRCNSITSIAHPPKFSPEDKWAEYRRRFKFPSS